MRRSWLATLSLLVTFTAGARASADERQMDIEARIARARDELGKKAPVEIVNDMFVFTAPPGDAPGLRGSTAFARSVLTALTNGRFAALPKKPLTVVLFFGKDPYERYCKTVLGDTACMSPYGFFLHDRRTIVMNAKPGLGTLSHELVHPLFDADFEDGPTWINEGIASLFEAAALGKPGEIHGVKNWRHPRLVNALRSKTERDNARLDRLFGMSDETFRGDGEDLHYATARYFCQWMDQQNKLWPFYQRWRDNKSTDPTGEKSFTAIMGKSPTDAHADFAKWVLAL